jgi:hypothetical protein
MSTTLFTECRGLLTPDRVWSRSEVLSDPSPVPKSPGVYAWYFRNFPPEIPTADYLRFNDLTLLYIGISPSAPPKNGKAPSKQNLFRRVRSHYRGNASGSTLRLSLGCLLSATLNIELRRAGSGNRLTFADGERRLSDWMEENAFVAWIERDEPWRIEEGLISTICLPLNLDQNRANRFHPVLSERRRLAKIRARDLPIWNYLAPSATMTQSKFNVSG